MPSTITITKRTGNLSGALDPIDWGQRKDPPPPPKSE
jgi:hypothetical protein